MSLPEPSAEALGHARRVTAHIRDVMAAAGGWLPFSDYMNLALYAPGLGYYSAGCGKLGPEGDFVTAPEISPAFGQALARQVADGLAQVPGHVLELGAGSGRLAVDVLTALAELEALPEQYQILEVSPDLIQRQRALIQSALPALADRVVWLERLPEAFRGVVLANEVLDALPVRLLCRAETGWLERGVVWSGTDFAWEERPITEGALLAAVASLPDQAPGYVTEVNLAASALIASLGERLERGLMIFIDYGFPRAEYYHPQRVGGTLMCHYRHRAHVDPFFLPGLQDITAHVDFTVLADRALEAGLEVAGYAHQASFLINCGVLEGLPADPSSRAYLQAVAGIQKLIQPQEMGELFKVMALAKGLQAPLRGFVMGDQRHRL